MAKINAAIFGASGYTGQELVRILLSHPQVNLIAASSRRYAGVPLAKVYPSLLGKTDMEFINATASEVAKSADVVFLALPHQVSQNAAGEIALTGKRIIDLSADFRLADVKTYEEWYTKHTQQDLLKKFVYGLPELFREEIKGAQMIANPGCYPTSILLALAPVVKMALIKNDSLIINSCSGVSGAGREPSVGSLFCEVAQGFKAYKAGGKHRHTPEIEQGLTRFAGAPVKVTFTPHLLPVNRGILSTSYASLAKKVTAAEIHACFQDFYCSENFVRIYPLGELPNINAVTGTNLCDIGIALDERTERLIIVSAIDNLVKGAAGQAAQNMNIIFDFPEGQGLETTSIFP
ncbi:MAG: N-acetyl-gamma-glutamyl-phosphate reductase [Deltaproteobacteria bacterium]|nr:N-acetyl-gamma-glutamyl-phosphate reductase [Deltaproteobacteria bacterium]